MSENKRFGVKTNWCVYENIDGIEKLLNFDEIAELLNELNDENKELKSLCKILITYIEEMSIEFVIDKDIKGILND